MANNNPIKPNRRALVTGGAGFVGSHLCRRLLEMGYSEVLCVDSLITGRLENISSLSSSSGFSFVRHDIIEPLSVEGKLDEIYNLACPASPKHYQQDPIHTFKTSVLGSLNLLDLAKTKGCKILQASTSEVYGDAKETPQAESYWGNVNPYGLRSCYDEGKRGAETLFHDYHQAYGVDTRIVRIFNTYGPCMSADDGRVIPNFITQALHGEPLTIYGDGSQTRSFMYIDDLIDALVLAMWDGVPHKPINIGNPQETTVRQLADTVIRLTGSHSKLAYLPLPADDPCKRLPDIAKCRKALPAWHPKVGLEEGLSNTIAYFTQHMYYGNG